MLRLVLLALSVAQAAQIFVLPQDTKTVFLSAWHVSWQDITDLQGRVIHVPVLVRRDSHPPTDHVRYAAPPQLGIVVKLDDTLRQARLAGDATTFDQILSDDFFEVDQDGHERTKAEMVASLRESKVESLTTTHLTAVAADNAVSITGQQEQVTAAKTVRVIFTHVYVREAGNRWKLLSSALTKMDE